MAETQSLPADPSQCVAVVIDAAASAEAQTDFSFDDAQRCPELVGCVGCELELAAAGQLYRAGRLDPDEQGPEEDGEEEHWAGYQLQGDHVGSGVICFSQALSGHDPGPADAPRFQLEVATAEAGRGGLVPRRPGSR